MSPLPRIRLVLGLAVGLAALAVLEPGAAQAQKKPVSNRVEIKTADGVLLKGALYPAQGDKRKEAVVLLLHHFDKDKGGSSKKDGGWQDLAAALQADGYPVLSFDFRGFGDSTEVVKERFWNAKNRHNVQPGGGLRAAAIKKKAATIHYKDFNAAYYPNLLSDIAAARAYLERRNDFKELNCSSIIVIGAGDGAAAGMAWLYNETRRRRDQSPPPVAVGFPSPLPAKTETEPESKDIAAAVWLSISPHIGPRPVGGSLGKWAAAAKRQGIPIAFLHGEGKDVKSRDVAQKILAEIKPQGAKGKDGVGKDKDANKLTGMKVFKANLVGEQLLDSNLDSIQWIKGHLKEVMEERGNKESVERDSAKARFLYTFPGKDMPLSLGGRYRISKNFSEEAPFVDTEVVFGK